MTSLSRRNRPTTASPITARATAIKFAALALLGAAAGLAPAADPPPFRPAAELPPGVMPPLPESAAVPIPVGATPGRVMTFRKQAGADRPQSPDLSKPEATAPGPEGEQYVRLPTRSEAFRLDNDEAMEKRILEELKKTGADNRFPPAPELAPKGTVYQPKTASYPPVRAIVEPGFVVHRRLYFEELNSERYGWDAGVLQPVLSTFLFYKDVLFWPGRLASNPHEHYDANSGKCLPGNPVPLLIYPPEIDIWGYAAAASLYTGIGFLVPTP